MGARAIVLMGFMGTGRARVGRRLAQRLGRAFVDTDQLVGSAPASASRDLYRRRRAAFRPSNGRSPTPPRGKP
jgi:shikimate kinase